jgi:hypothetical protein
MNENTFFRNKIDRYAFAVTPDETGSVLPSPDQWQRWFSQPVHPELAVEGSDLRELEAGFRQQGYYIYPFGQAA